VRIRAFGAETGRLVVASGVLVRKAGSVVVATAGRTLASFDAEEVGPIHVILTDGTRLRAEILDLRTGTAFRDWAYLWLHGAASRDLAAVPIGKVNRGESVFLLGYPDHLGVDARGEVVHGLAGPPDSMLSPLPLAGRIDHVDPLLIAPVAGAMPLAGATGAPFFNSRGEAVAILTTTVETPDRAGMNFVLQATSLHRSGKKKAGAQ
jgi:hypothetical protein